MNNQVLSIEQMQKLKELGIDTSKASMCWYHYYVGMYTKGWECLPKDIEDYAMIPRIDSEDILERVPTFTLQDILEMLPSYNITYDKHTNNSDRYKIRIDILEGQHYITPIAHSANSLLEAAFKMLKWCKQNNYI